MNLNDYLDFLSVDDIRARGHRIGIEDILYYDLEGYSPEEIGAQFPSLTQASNCGASCGSDAEHR